jgi:Flp pilus assembly protein CpaB
MPARNSLAPTIADRIRHALRPGWTRSLLLRRACAVVLLVVALVATLTAGRTEELRSAVVAARDVSPGHRLTADDLTIRDVAPDTLPAGAMTQVSDLTDKTVTGPVRSGEIITDVRVLSSRLPMELLQRADARLVPVKLADTAVIDLLREGDVVDVLSIDDSSEDQPSATRVLANSAVVALVSQPTGSRTGADTRLAILALPEHDAHVVAAATLTAPITVVFH